jgi:hypothetical protein
MARNRTHGRPAGRMPPAPRGGTPPWLAERREAARRIREEREARRRDPERFKRIDRMLAGHHPDEHPQHVIALEEFIVIDHRRNVVAGPFATVARAVIATERRFTHFIRARNVETAEMRPLTRVEKGEVERVLAEAA